MDTNVLISVAGFIVSVITTLSITVWKLSNFASRLVNLEDKQKDNKSDQNKLDELLQALNIKIEVLSHSHSNLNSQIAELLGKQDNRIEKLEDIIDELRTEAIKHSQCYHYTMRSKQ